MAARFFRPPRPFRRRRPTWLALVLAAVPACLGVSETPKKDQDASVADADVFDVPYDVPTLDDCTRACIAKAPAGESNFLLVSACTQGAPTDVCAEACSGAGSDAGATSCPVPGVLDPDPACNACIKDTCCPVLRACFGSADCLTVALCAAACVQ